MPSSSAGPWRRLRREHVLFALYALALVGLTLMHAPVLLATAIGGLVLLAGRDGPRLILRALRLVLPWLAAVDLGYVLVAQLRPLPAWDSLLPLNLRVLALTLLTLVFAARVNLLRALDFSPTLVWLFTLAVSQAQHWRRVQEDFRLALACRSPGPPGLRARLRASAAAAAWFIDQAIAAAREQAQALRARGLIR